MSEQRNIGAGQIFTVAYMDQQKKCAIFESKGELFFYFGHLCFSVYELNYNPHFRILD